MRIAVCDDDLKVCEQLVGVIDTLNETSLEHSDVKVYHDGIDLYNDFLSGVTFDIVILDIQMEQLDGVSLGNLLRDKLKNEYLDIIYISSERDFAMDLFHSRPLNFLVKPVNEDELIESLKKSVNLREKGIQNFEFKVGTTSHRIPVKEIIYFEGRGRKVKVTSIKGVYEFYGKMSDIKKKLTDFDFMTIHKSYIINYKYIKEITYESVKMSNNVTLVISQNYRSVVRAEQLSRGGKK